MDDLDRSVFVTSHRIDDRPVNTKAPMLASADVLWETRTLVTMLIIATIAGVAVGVMLSMLVLLD
jgi:hypothetical protein